MCAGSVSKLLVTDVLITCQHRFDIGCLRHTFQNVNWLPAVYAKAQNFMFDRHCSFMLCLFIAVCQYFIQNFWYLCI